MPFTSSSASALVLAVLSVLAVGWSGLAARVDHPVSRATLAKMIHACRSMYSGSLPSCAIGEEDLVTYFCGPMGFKKFSLDTFRRTNDRSDLACNLMRFRFVQRNFLGEHVSISFQCLPDRGAFPHCVMSLDLTSVISGNTSCCNHISTKSNIDLARALLEASVQEDLPTHLSRSMDTRVALRGARLSKGPDLNAKMVAACRTLSSRTFPSCVDLGASDTFGGELKPVNLFCGPAGFKKDSLHTFKKTGDWTHVTCSELTFNLVQQKGEGEPIVLMFQCKPVAFTRRCVMLLDFTTVLSDNACCNMPSTKLNMGLAKELIRAGVNVNFPMGLSSSFDSRVASAMPRWVRDPPSQTSPNLKPRWKKHPKV